MSDDGDVQSVSHKERVLFTASFMLGLMAMYLMIGWIQNDNLQAVMLPTPVDLWIDFSLAWLPVYLFMLPISWAPACVLKDKRCLRRWVISVLLMYLIALPIWMFWPVTVPRNPVEVDGFWSFTLSVMRAVDPPMNCLPSMHVAVATMAGLLIRRVDPLVGTILLLVMPFIWFSTMALDQHWFVDGLMGMCIAVIVEKLTHEWMPVPTTALAVLDRRFHWAWIGPYLAVVIGVWLYWRFAA